MDQNIKLMFLDEHAIEGARFGVSSKELTFLGGFQNFIYSYDRNDMKYILRFTASTHRTGEELATEIEWIRYLSENGLAVSDSISSMNGNDFERIRGTHIDFYVTSFRYAPGRKIGYPECLGNPLLYEQCGRLTGRLHELSKRYKQKVKGTLGKTMNTSYRPKNIYRKSTYPFFLRLMILRDICPVSVLLLIISD